MQRTKHANISIFVPHIGCPHRCSFCDQRTISGAQHAPSADDVRQLCRKALGEVKSPENTEIAFFGGSFTAIPKAYMTELLEAANGFVGEGKFRGIRVSTRPDCIDREVLGILKKYGVTAIELGAQSMCDHVLEVNERGHSAADVVNACGLIREYGFELGLQMMVGLYKSTEDDEWATFRQILKLRPETVRIYPVVVLENTRLGELYRSGEYRTFSFKQVVEMVSIFLMAFENDGIRVIKCGLHASEFVEHDMIGGFYHPAFRELCENEIYKMQMEEMIAHETSAKTDFTFAVNPSCISKAIGQNRSNINYFESMILDAPLKYKIKIIGDESIPKYKVEQR